MGKERGFWESYRTDCKKLNANELHKALIMYSLLSPWVWALSAIAFILGTQLKCH